MRRVAVVLILVLTVLLAATLLNGCTKKLPVKLVHDVPFTCQAPFADWDDPRQQNGCEEACMVMANRWLRKKGLTKQEALEEILALADYQQEKYGFFQDTSAEDTAKIWQKYYEGSCIVTKDFTLFSFRNILASGHILMVPVNGKVGLSSPSYNLNNIDRHMLLVIGYDDEKEEFVVNDPGTGKGEKCRFNYGLFLAAIQDYPSGDKVPRKSVEKRAIIVLRIAP